MGTPIPPFVEDRHGRPVRITPDQLVDMMKEQSSPKPLSGGSQDYYLIDVPNPTRGSTPYTAECNDIIEALGLSFAEGNVLKAIWRIAKARQGQGKPGVSTKYDAEKIVFFGERILKSYEDT